ncbi:MAG: hypothetical protein WC657_02535 [Candidatus Paceibacterota bacterium]
MIFRKIYNLSDSFEDKTRVKLSHYPILYAFIGGTGVVIFWRGIWHTTDYIMSFFTIINDISSTSGSQLPWWDGPLSIVVGAILLLTVGLFVTSFIGNEIILSGLRQEKKIAEKTEEELKKELSEDFKVEQKIHEINERSKQIEELLKTLNSKNA